MKEVPIWGQLHLVATDHEHSLTVILGEAVRLPLLQHINFP